MQHQGTNAGTKSPKCSSALDQDGSVMFVAFSDLYEDVLSKCVYRPPDHFCEIIPVHIQN